MSFSLESKGNWDKTTKFLQKARDPMFSILDKYAQQGVAALAAATPMEEGETSRSWTYDIVRKRGYYAVHWRNTNVEDGIPIAIILQYGHGTRTGGYVQGREYIMTAIRPIFDQMAAEMWKEVTK